MARGETAACGGAMLRRVLGLVGAAVDLKVDRWRDQQQNPHPIARIAFNKRPRATAWGGGNQWLNQMVRWLRVHGYSVCFTLDPDVDCIMLVDPRPVETVTFGVSEIQVFKRRHPEAVCIHRINENDQHRQSRDRNAALAEANTVADHTIFISSWVRDYHAARWFHLERPHSVIHNGADPDIFYPARLSTYAPGGTLRLVTHHWSDNWAKGFRVYQQIDELIASGQLRELELWVIGRWPKELRWKRATTFPPARGKTLAELLRRCHVYLTASQWESGGMHWIEGAQCGLPVIYHADGGGIGEVASRFGVEFREDLRSAVLDIRARYPALRQAVLKHAPSGDRMCDQYRRLIEDMLAAAQSSRIERVVPV